MKKILIPVLVAAGGLIANAAFAASMAANGIVKSVDTKHDSIMLNDGSEYTLAEGSEAEDFVIGEKVTIKFKTQNGKMIATSVKVVK